MPSSQSQLKLGSFLQSFTLMSSFSDVSGKSHTDILKTYIPPTQLLINNEWVDGVDKETIPIVDPASEEVICHVAGANAKDVDLAVAAARKATDSWAKYDPTARSLLMLKLADLIERDKEIIGLQIQLRHS